MVAARIGAVLVFLVSSLAAQRPSQGHVVITVTDQTGAPISDVRIGTKDPPGYGAQVLAITNASGEANLDLAPGSYALSVDATGFEAVTKKIDIQNATNQLYLTFTLTVRPIIDWVSISPDDQGILVPTEPYVLNPVLPLEPLLSLPLIPCRVHKRHFLKKVSHFSSKPS